MESESVKPHVVVGSTRSRIPGHVWRSDRERGLITRKYYYCEEETFLELKDLNCSLRWPWRMPPSGMSGRMDVRTDILEELIASIFRVERINELGTTLAVTSKLDFCSWWNFCQSQEITARIIQIYVVIFLKISWKLLRKFQSRSGFPLSHSKFFQIYWFYVLQKRNKASVTILRKDLSIINAWLNIWLMSSVSERDWG
jgi:hypothetical protein